MTCGLSPESFANVENLRECDRAQVGQLCHPAKNPQPHPVPNIHRQTGTMLQTGTIVMLETKEAIFIAKSCCRGRCGS